MSVMTVHSEKEGDIRLGDRAICDEDRRAIVFRDFAEPLITRAQDACQSFLDPLGV